MMRDTEWAIDVWHEAFDFLFREAEQLAKLPVWRGTLETFAIAWKTLLRGEPTIRHVFHPITTNRTWDIDRILYRKECLKMGWPPVIGLMEYFYETGLPPPAATLDTDDLTTYWGVTSI